MSEKPFEVPNGREKGEKKGQGERGEEKKTSAGPRHYCAHSVLLQQSLRVKEATPTPSHTKKNETLSRDIVH